MKIGKPTGRKRGKRGTRIQVYDETGKQKSYSMTVQGTDTKTLFTNIKFFLKVLEKSNGKNIKIKIGG